MNFLRYIFCSQTRYLGSPPSASVLDVGTSAAAANVGSFSSGWNFLTWSSYVYDLRKTRWHFLHSKCLGLPRCHNSGTWGNWDGGPTFCVSTTDRHCPFQMRRARRSDSPLNVSQTSVRLSPNRSYAPTGIDCMIPEQEEKMGSEEVSIVYPCRPPLPSSLSASQIRGFWTNQNRRVSPHTVGRSHSQT